MKCLIKMQVFDIRWKHGGVFLAVSLGIEIHPPDPNGCYLLAFVCMNNFWV